MTAAIAGVPVTVLYAGTAPGLPSGVAQINVRIPMEVQPNSFAPVALTIGGATTQPGVTIAIR